MISAQAPCACCRFVWWGVYDRSTGCLVAAFPDSIDAHVWHDAAQHRMQVVHLMERDGDGDALRWLLQWRATPTAYGAAFRDKKAATAYAHKADYVICDVPLCAVPRNEWDEC